MNSIVRQQIERLAAETPGKLIFVDSRRFLGQFAAGSLKGNRSEVQSAAGLAAGADVATGLAELARVGAALGGEAQTFFGLSGVGDLILTCSSSQSRNRQVGEGLGRGKLLPAILETLKGTAEGVRTARSVHQILEEKKIEAPILREVYMVLYENKSPRSAVKALMGREAKSE